MENYRRYVLLNMNLEVRKATLKDLPTLLKFEQGLIEAERPMDSTIKDEYISYYDIAGFIKSEYSEVYVVALNDEIVASGYAIIKADRHYLKHKKQAHLGFMFVPKKHRGKGFNKLIIAALLKWCKKKVVFEIRLDVYQDNVAAIKAYKKVGFKKHMIKMRLNLEDLDIS